VTLRDLRLHPKQLVVGINIDNRSKAWCIKHLKEKRVLNEKWHGMELTIHYQKDGDRVIITDRKSGKTVPHTRLYWFTWAAFQPDTDLYRSK